MPPEFEEIVSYFLINMKKQNWENRRSSFAYLRNL